MAERLEEIVTRCEGQGRSNMIEEFFKAHQDTIAAIAAAGTVGAVVTSLWLAWSARRADRTRLKAHADIELIFEVPYLNSDHFSGAGSACPV